MAVDGTAARCDFAPVLAAGSTILIRYSWQVAPDIILALQFRCSSRWQNLPRPICHGSGTGTSWPSRPARMPHRQVISTHLKR
jgi:hypothetical protein